VSQLTNVAHQLAWSEFTTHKSDPLPAPGTVAPAAYTKPVIATSGFGLAGIPGSKPPKGQVKDTIVVGVSLGAESWVEDWVFNLPQAKQDDLLNHEQGHFNVGALLARDFYYDLLKLRQKQYNSPTESNADFETLKKARDAAMVSIVKKYDDDTKHGTVAAQQTRWDGFFTSATTQLRSPSETAPDGTPLKIRLVDLLKSYGITV
jgi:hypothetical protein